MAYQPDGRRQFDCKFFLQGRCTQGDACPFLHNVAKLHASTSYQQQAFQPQPYCRFFNTPGGCMNSVCPFRHVPIGGPQGYVPQPELSVEARLDMPLGGTAPPFYGAPLQEEPLHITLDEQRPSAIRSLTALEQRAIVLGRAEAPGGYQPNGRSPAPLRAGLSQPPPQHQPQPLRPHAAKPAAPSARSLDSRLNTNIRLAGGQEQVRLAEAQRAASRVASQTRRDTYAIRKEPEPEPELDERRPSVFERLRGPRAPVAAVRAGPASTVHMVRKRKVDELGADVGGGERLVRVIGDAALQAARQQLNGERAIPPAPKHATGTVAPAHSLSERLSVPGARTRQAPRQLQSPLSGSDKFVTSVAQQRPSAAGGQQQPAMRTVVSLRAAPQRLPPQQPVDPVTAVDVDRLLDRPLSDRLRKVEARLAAPMVKTLEELRRERQLKQQKEEQCAVKSSTAAKKAISACPAASVPVAAPAVKAAPARLQPAGVVSKPPAAHAAAKVKILAPATKPAVAATAAARLAGQPVAAAASESAAQSAQDDFLWDAADVGDEPTEEEEDFEMGAEEPALAVGAAPAAEENDFSKRMAMLAQAFS